MTRKNPRELVFVGILLAGLFFCGTSFGADAAMVTNVSGEVKAVLGQEEWTPSVAETLSAATKLKLAAGSSITLVHLGLHKEIELAGPREIELMNDSIKGGEDGKGTALSEISPNLDLKDQHLFEAGGVKPDNARQEPVKEKKSLEIDPSASRTVSDFASGGQDHEEQPSESGMATPQDIEKGIQDQLDDKNKSVAFRVPPAAAPAPKPSKSGGEVKKEIQNELASPTFFVGFPNELLQKQFGSLPERLVTIDGAHQLKNLDSGMEGWALFGCASLQAGAEQKLAFNNGAKEASMLEITIGLPLPRETEKPLLAALVYESEKRWAQAAVLWLDLAKQGRVKKAQAAQHLARLAKKMSQ